jgi:hypothetical protein
METKSGIGKEPLWMSRRVWGAALSLLAVISLVVLPERAELFAGIFSVVAGGLGLTSWIMPKN